MGKRVRNPISQIEMGFFVPVIVFLRISKLFRREEKMNFLE